MNLKGKKLGPKTIDAIFIGYTHNSNANGFLVINSEVNEISNNTIIKARDATYFEGIFPFRTKVSNEVKDRPSGSKNSFSGET